MSFWKFAILLLGQPVFCRRPNILFILTDDQDSHMQSMEHMPYVNVRLTTEHLVSRTDIKAGSHCE